jgi:hypothetical protein
VSGRAVAAIGIAVVLTEAILLVTDTGPNVWLVAAVVALVGVTIWFPASIARFVMRPAPAPRPPHSPTSFPDLRTTTLRQALATGDTDPRHAERVRRQLIVIVDDELLAVHGIDRATDPDAARAVLGRDVDRFVTNPDAAASLTPRSLAHVLTLIERI